jgi:hypothetical protein
LTQYFKACTLQAELSTNIKVKECSKGKTDPAGGAELEYKINKQVLQAD